MRAKYYYNKFQLSYIYLKYIFKDYRNTLCNPPPLKTRFLAFFDGGGGLQSLKFFFSYLNI